MENVTLDRSETLQCASTGRQTQVTGRRCVLLCGSNQNIGAEPSCRPKLRNRNKSVVVIWAALRRWLNVASLLRRRIQSRKPYLTAASHDVKRYEHRAPQTKPNPSLVSKKSDDRDGGTEKICEQGRVRLSLNLTAL